MPGAATMATWCSTRFRAAGYVDQALAGSVDSFVVDLARAALPTDPEANNSSFSSLFQGLMFDPLMLSGRSRTANLFAPAFCRRLGRRRLHQQRPDDWGWSGEGELQGYVQTPIPWSFYGKIDADQSDDFRSDTTPGVSVPTSQFNLQFENISGTGYITAKPTPNDRIVAYFDMRRNEPDLLGGLVIQVPPVPFTLGVLPGFGPVDGTAPRRHLRPDGRRQHGHGSARVEPHVRLPQRPQRGGLRERVQAGQRRKRSRRLRYRPVRHARRPADRREPGPSSKPIWGR